MNEPNEPHEILPLSELVYGIIARRLSNFTDRIYLESAATDSVLFRTEFKIWASNSFGQALLGNFDQCLTFNDRVVRWKRVVSVDDQTILSRLQIDIAER